MRHAIQFCLSVVVVLALAPTAVIAAGITHTPIRQDPATSMPLLFSDDFAGKDPGWEIGTEADGEFRRAGGVLYVRDIKQSPIPTGLDAPIKAADTVIEVDSKLVSGAESTWMSAFCRGKGGSDFAFYWRADGMYSAVLWIDDDGVREAASAHTDAIHHGTGALNHIKVSCIGDRLEGWINGVKLVDWVDDRLSSGSPGLGVEVIEGETAEAAFDNFIVYGTKSQTATPELPSEPTVGGLKVTVNNPTLNVRSGPDTTYAKIGAVKQGDLLPVLGRNDGCTWAYVETPAGAGWVSAAYVKFNGDCELAPLVTSDATQAPGKTTPPATATEASGNSQAPKSTLVTGFETFGTWRRGDEPWAEFTQAGEQFTNGKYSGKLAYDFPADVPNDRNYVVFLRAMPIAGKPDALRMQVYGDASGAFLNAWIKDAAGQRWQFTFGPVTHSGWRRLEAPLDTTLKWPVQRLDGSGKALTYPLTFEALVLDYPTDKRAHGSHLRRSTDRRDDSIENALK
ncbi:MAG: SH3 domain-containing protein [Anaerolineales bacterium]|nr:SH3 domain-containing protein [Anaerolineales bacterium]